MSSYCNSIFFCCKDVKIDELQSHMLTNQNKTLEPVVAPEPVVELKPEPVVEPEQQQEPEQEQKQEQKQEQEQEQEQQQELEIVEEKNTITQDVAVVVKEPLPSMQPKQTDTLFWCLYIAIFGYNDYLEVSRNYGVKELDIKKQIADYLQGCPGAFKQTNVKVTKVAIQEIRSDLLTSQKETSILCLLAMIVKYKINVALVDPSDRFYLEYYYDTCSEDPVFIIQKDTFGKYKLQNEPLSKEMLATWKESRTALESYLKPLRAISLYKVSELEELAEKVGVLDDKKKYKKAELYNDISEVLRWR